MSWREDALPLERKKICSCGKVCFDKRGAQTKRNQMNQHRHRHSHEVKLRIYQCTESDWWHLTKTSGRWYDRGRKYYED
jgi:hypothetical protein